MDHDDFPWRLLGTLLVDRELLTAAQLEQALAEQRRTGRLLGQILVTRGWVSALALARVLAEQHGVELKTVAETPPTAPQPPAPTDRVDRAWLPLGRLLVANGLVTRADLNQALSEQARDQDRRLGEILVTAGRLSGVALACTLAEQHGVRFAPEDGDELETVIAPALQGQPRYRVHEPAFEPAYRTGPSLYESTNFLEATDFAFEYVEREQPGALEIQKAVDGDFETVWTYSERRADAGARSKKSLVAKYGFDPARWDTSSRFAPAKKQP
jgi:hypothetical protein